MLGLAFNADYKAPRSPYSIKSKFNPPKGPKSVYRYGSSEEAQAAMVLPQKFPFAKSTVASFGLIFFSMYPHLLANLIALSPA